MPLVSREDYAELLNVLEATIESCRLRGRLHGAGSC